MGEGLRSGQESEMTQREVQIYLIPRNIYI